MRRKSCPDEFQCLLCDSTTCCTIKTGLPGVTSDLRPWPRSGIFAVCSNCGHVQKLLNQDWIDDVERIYSSYEMYTVSGGQEQRLFDSGLPLPRSVKLLENLIRVLELPDEGRLLDFGCGNGAFLKSFSRFLSGWRLGGFDINKRFADSLSAIEGFEGLYTDSLEQIDELFELVTMVYVIEHLDEPQTILARLQKLIKPEGALFVQTSSFEENPFDLMVVDHCSHFSLPTLSFLVSRAGFQVVSDTRGWVSKELGVISVPTSDGKLLSNGPDFVANQQLQLRASINWLESVLNQAKSLGKDKELGIFGTAIAGTWLSNCLENKCSFFVDEDPFRIGKRHLGLLIKHPTEVADKTLVYLAFPAKMAKELFVRLSSTYPNINFLLPPG